MIKTNNQLLVISISDQKLYGYENDQLQHTFIISSAKNGAGEQIGSGCTPRGWHKIASIIGRDKPVNSVFVAREWTGEIYTPELAAQYPQRDWILTCIMQLDGLEPARNRGGEVDSLARFIYIHGTPDSVLLGTPGSKGCIRMRNKEILILADWVKLDTIVFIQ